MLILTFERLSRRILTLSTTALIFTACGKSPVVGDIIVKCPDKQSKYSLVGYPSGAFVAAVVGTDMGVIADSATGEILASDSEGVTSQKAGDSIHVGLINGNKVVWEIGPDGVPRNCRVEN